MSIADQVQAVGDYWDGHPEPLPDDPTLREQIQFGREMSEWEAKFGEDGPPVPPEPPTIPGPATPGAGMPAARIGDLSAHAGAIVGPGCPTVIIAGQPAACVLDQAVCPVWDALVPHVCGGILAGSTKVLIAGRFAARVSDPIGPPGNCKGNAVALGCNRVLIA